MASLIFKLVTFFLAVAGWVVALPSMGTCDSAARLAIARGSLQAGVTWNIPALEALAVTPNATLGFSINGSPALFTPPSDVIFHHASVLFSYFYLQADIPTFVDDASAATVVITSISHYGNRITRVEVFTAHVVTTLSFTPDCRIYQNRNDLSDIKPVV